MQYKDKLQHVNNGGADDVAVLEANDGGLSRPNATRLASANATIPYKDKLKQANREARAACLGLCGTIIVWALCGFGVSCFDIEVCSIPLWIITGCGCTFLFAIGVSIWMAYFVMKDVGLDDEESSSSGTSGEELVAGALANDSQGGEHHSARCHNVKENVHEVVCQDKHHNTRHHAAQEDITEKGRA